MNLRKRLIETLYRITTGARKTRNLLTPLGLVFFFTLVFLFIITSLLLDRLLLLPPLFPLSLNIILAIPVLVIGSFLMLWSILYFIRRKGTPVPFNPPPRLVTAGPYAHIRNPMLSGVFIIMLGFGFLFRSISLVFVFTPLFVLANIIELKLIEEPELKKRLGKKYIEYMKKTPMFIPGLSIKREINDH
jgi:protein-S-isoprenylcysteine O-methyltransferase Ste14